MAIPHGSPAIKVTTDLLLQECGKQNRPRAPNNFFGINMLRIVIIAWFCLVVIPSAWAIKEACWKLGIWASEVQHWSEHRDHKLPPEVELIRDGNALLRIGTRWFWFGTVGAGSFILLSEVARIFVRSKK